MRSVLFLDDRQRLTPFLDYCKDNDVQYHIGTEPDFIPDIIISGKDYKADLEYELSWKYMTDNRFDSEVRDFFLYKSKQDEVCREIDVPTIPNVSNKVIVKVDRGQSGGEGSYVCGRSEAGDGFIQDYMNITHVDSVHCWADDEGQWHPITYGRMEYENNCPARYNTPDFSNKEYLDDCVDRLSKRLLIRNRVCYWQFLNGYYHMDFNCRVSGGFENGTFDREISNASIVSYAIEGVQPNEIRYTNRIRLEYTGRRQFGYTGCSRLRIPLVYDQSSGRYEEASAGEAAGFADSYDTRQ